MNARLVSHGTEGYVDIGRTVWNAEELVFVAGQHSPALFPDVCVALS